MNESNPGEQFGTQVSSELRTRALDAIKHHPHFLAASANGFCVPTVKLRPAIEFIEGGRWDITKKAMLKASLDDSPSILIISLITATTRQAALSGTGIAYEFALHPKTLTTLHTANGGWIC